MRRLFIAALAGCVLAPIGTVTQAQTTTPIQATPETPAAASPAPAPGAATATPPAGQPGGTPDAPLVPPANVGSPSATGGAELEAGLPTVLYDPSTLPEAVRATRAKIIAATKTGDPEALRALISAQAEPPSFPGGDGPDPIQELKLLSGDEEGREILAILEETIESGFVHIDVGTPQEMYVWPYFYRYPLDKLAPPQLVELFRLIGAGDLADMREKGVYSFYRVGISPDGQWRFFEDGD